MARLLTGDRGEVTTQLVLLTPVLLVLVLTVVQIAMLWHAAHLADAAAAAGASRAAGLEAGATDGMTAARAFADASGARLEGSPLVVRGAVSASATVVVHVPRLLPGFPGTVRRTATMPVERFVPEADR